MTSELEEIAGSMLPKLMGDGFGDTPEAKRASYLAKRICNFSVREACQLADVSEKSVRRWREADPEFNHLDTAGMSKLREALSTRLIDFQFSRNFHLILEKDFKILYKDATAPLTMTERDRDYLNKIRQHYTPQSLAMIKQLLGGGTVDQPFDFTKFVLTLKREQITIVEEKHMI